MPERRKNRNDIFRIKRYGFSNLDEMNVEEMFEENRNNNLNSSTSTQTQKQFSIVKTMINIKMNETKKQLILDLLERYKEKFLNVINYIHKEKHDVKIDYERLIDYVDKLDSINPHAVKPLYIKRIEVLK